LGPVLRAYALVPVGVENGGDEEDELVQACAGGTEDDVPGEHQGSLLALDFPGVDVGLDVDDHPLVGSETIGGSGDGTADDEKRDRAALRALAQGLDPDERAQPLEFADEGHDVCVSRRRGIVRRFGDRPRPLLGRERNLRHYRNEDDRYDSEILQPICSHVVSHLNLRC